MINNQWTTQFNRVIKGTATTPTGHSTVTHPSNLTNSHNSNEALEAERLLRLHPLPPLQRRPINDQDMLLNHISTTSSDPIITRGSPGCTKGPTTATTAAAAVTAGRKSWVRTSEPSVAAQPFFAGLRTESWPRTRPRPESKSTRGEESGADKDDGGY